MKSKKLFIIAAALLLISSCNGGLPGTSSSSSNNVNESTSSAISSNVNEGTSTSTGTSTGTSQVTSNQTSTGTSISSTSSQTQQAKTYTVSIGSSTTVSSRLVCSNGISYASDNGKIYTDVAGAVRFGSSNGAGQIVFNLSSASVVKTIVVDCSKYNNDSSSQLKITLSNGESQTLAIGNRQEYYFSFSGNSSSNKITFENLAKSQRVNMYGVTITSETVTSSGTTSSNTSSAVSSNTTSQTTSKPSSSASTSQGNVNYDSMFDPSNDSYSGTYYSSISSTATGDTLVKALGAKITHSGKSYGDLWTAYKTTDKKPGTNYIWDIYSTFNFTIGSKQCGNYSVEGDCYNREHTVPQSWFGEASPMKSDVFHVLPTDGKVNGVRSNYPYGEVGTASYTSSNGSKLGTSSVSGISGTVFEPIDEYKGDIARIYFYMCTRYYSQVGSWGGGVFQGSHPYIKSNYFNLYLQWAIDDPVSQKEIDRNNAAYAFQGNRNPYVDCPSLFYRAFIAK